MGTKRFVLEVLLPALGLPVAANAALANEADGFADDTLAVVVGEGEELSNTFAFLEIDINASTIVVSNPTNFTLIYEDANGPFTGTVSNSHWAKDLPPTIKSISVKAGGITGSPIVTHGVDSVFFDIAGGTGKSTSWAPLSSLTIAVQLASS